MNRTEEWHPHGPASASAVDVDDARVIQALHEYLAALEAGQQPDRQAFLAGYPEVREALAECLDGLEFVHTAAPQIPEFVAADPLLAAAGDNQAPVPLGDFRIVREIGRGGMGVVYEVHQLSLNRRVALKVLPFAATLDPKHLQRFKNEAQAAAQLHHNNIVPVFAVGCERGIGVEKIDFMPKLFTPEDLSMMLRLRSAFNPEGRCSPAKVFPTAGACIEPSKAGRRAAL